MTRKKASKLGIKTIDDLKKFAGDLKLGTDYVFLDRLEWKNIRDLYKIDFQKKTPTGDKIARVYTSHVYKFICHCIFKYAIQRMDLFM